MRGQGSAGPEDAIRAPSCSRDDYAGPMRLALAAIFLLAPATAATADDTPFFDWADYRSAFAGDMLLSALFGADSSESDSYLRMTRNVLQLANYVHMTGGSEIRKQLLEDNEVTAYPGGLSTAPAIPLFLSACLASGISPLDYRLGLGVYEDRSYELTVGTLEGVGNVVTLDGWSENFIAQLPRIPDLTIGHGELEFVKVIREDARPEDSVFRSRGMQKGWLRKGRIQDRRYWQSRPYDARKKRVRFANSVVRYIYRLPEGHSTTTDTILNISVGTLDLGSHFIFREQLLR